MEEYVGHWWHRFITRMARDRHPEAAVTLSEMRPLLGVYFRALGGDGGLRIAGAEATRHQARRNWRQRIAGTGTEVELAWRDEQSLRLPETIDWFADPALNRELYFWLAALATGDGSRSTSWFQHHQQLCQRTLNRFPGLEGRYQRLVQAHLTQRPDPRQLPPDAADQEQAIRQALQQPGTVAAWPSARQVPWPVPLWLHPDPPQSAVSRSPAADQEPSPGGATRDLDDLRRRSATRVKLPQKKGGLIAIRMENILTWGEFTPVDRASEEEEDLDQAADAARNMEQLAVSRDAQTTSRRLRFDLDLPAECNDDAVVGPGIMLPEWDWRRDALIPGHCRLLPMEATHAPPCPLPQHLAAIARRLRAQFEQLAPSRVWRSAQPDGSEIDLDACLRWAADRAAGHAALGAPLYRRQNAGNRDLACLLLADLSLSTDTYVDDQHRVIEVIRDSLFLFAEALAATGDRFALYGFSSRKRDPVRFHRLKEFNQPYDALTRGRIAAIRPGYYTRMGAALRHAQTLLQQQPAERRLLLLLSDGKPNDLDQYEGRYGIEDTRHAIHEVRQAGLEPFCVTIDERGNDYLPYLFGSGGYLVIRNPRELPRKLPLLYARLTR